MSEPHCADSPRARDGVTAWGTSERVTTVCELRQENQQGCPGAAASRADLGSVTHEP